MGRGRWCKQLLMTKEKIGYCKWKQEALDSTLWINAMKGRWTCRKIDNSVWRRWLAQYQAVFIHNFFMLYSGSPWYGLVLKCCCIQLGMPLSMMDHRLAVHYFPYRHFLKTTVTTIQLIFRLHLNPGRCNCHNHNTAAPYSELLILWSLLAPP